MLLTGGGPQRSHVRQLLNTYRQNPMGLATSTLNIRKQLLQVFERTWKFGLGIKASDVKPIMLKSWLALRRQTQSLKASGLNNYIRMLHGLFHLAVELGAVVESPAKAVKLLKEESPERLTPTWEQAQAIIGAAKRQSSKDVLSAMLLMGLGQAEIANLLGEHIDFARGQIAVRRQKTQKVFTIPMYPQVRPLLERLRAEGQIVPGKPLFERARPREALSLACRRLAARNSARAASGVLLLFVLWKRGLMQGVWHRGRDTATQRSFYGFTGTLFMVSTRRTWRNG